MRCCRYCKCKASDFAKFCPACHAFLGDVPHAESLLKRNKIILLCFFFGVLGLHRFYLRKPYSGALMLFTLGGLGIWVVIDFFYYFFMDYRDDQNTVVASDYHKGLWILVPAMLVLCAITFLCPSYKMMENERFSSLGAKAATDLVRAQERHLLETGFYARSPSDLIVGFYLDYDQSIRYGHTHLYANFDGRNCHTFSLMHKKAKSGIIGDSCKGIWKVPLRDP
jgi:TM2 domain-containing membrane protein YozV